MPTYDYVCKGCKREFEEFQSITAKPLKKCEKCGGKLQRLIGGGAGILFKGSGFYQTDYRSKSYQEGSTKENTKKDSPKESSKTTSEKPKKSDSSSQTKSSSK